MEKAIFEMIYGLFFRSNVIVVPLFVFLFENFKRYLLLPVLAGAGIRTLVVRVTAQKLLPKKYRVI